MSTEVATFRSRAGATSTAVAEVVRYGLSARIGRASLPVVGGLVFGLVMVPVPLVHFVAPWLMPLIGLALAAFVLGIRARVASVRGVCPECAAPLEADALGYVGKDPIWLRCSGCKAPVELTVDPG